MRGMPKGTRIGPTPRQRQRYPCVGCLDVFRLSQLQHGWCSECRAETVKPPARTFGLVGDEAYAAELDRQALEFSRQVRDEAGA